MEVNYLGYSVKFGRGGGSSQQACTCEYTRKLFNTLGNSLIHQEVQETTSAQVNFKHRHH